MTKNGFERKMQQDRLKEDFQNSLKKTIRESEIWRSIGESNARVQGARERRVRKEQELIKQKRDERIKKERETRKRIAIQEQEEKLSKELQRRENEVEREIALHRRICAQSEDLKALELKLRSHLMNKERAIEIVDKQRRISEINEKNRMIDLEQSTHQTFGSDDIQLAKREKALKEQKIVLEQQLIEKEMRKNEEYRIFLQEKAEIDAVVEEIERQEREKAEKTAMKMAETKKFVEDYLVQRAKWLKQQKISERAELDKIQEHQTLLDARKSAEEKERDLKRQTEQKKYERVVGEIEKQRDQQEEMERMLMDLAIEEAQLKMLKQEEERLRKKELMRKNMITENLEQQRLKAQRIAKEKEEEDRIRIQLLEKFAQDDKLEQISREKARRKTIEHKREVEKILIERRLIREREAEQERVAEEKAIRAEEIKRKIIEEERQRLLADYAKNAARLTEKRRLQEENNGV